MYGLLHVTMDRTLSHFYHDNDYDDDDDDDDSGCEKFERRKGSR